MKKILFYLLILSALSKSKAQNLQWVTSMGATTTNAASNKVISDASGNVLTVGFFGGITDFSPGAGTFTLASGGTYNGFIQKLTTAGAFVWAKGFVGTGYCNVKGVATDAAGNVYVTGMFNGAIDFDPGAGVTTLTTSATTDDDVFICKLTSGGLFVWAKQIGSLSWDDIGNAITLDPSNNVFVCGALATSNSGTNPITVDMDPGIGVVNATTNTSADGFVIKLDNNGNYLLNQLYGGADNSDAVMDIETDATGNVYICGYFYYAVLSLFPMNAADLYGAFTAKLTNNLVKIWSTRTNNPGGNFSTKAYANNIEVDAAGNVYYSGTFINWTSSVDFDPGAPNVILPQVAQVQSGFVSKLSSTGTFMWAKNIVSSGAGNCTLSDMSLDGSNNIYSVGTFTGTADFNLAGSGYDKTSVGSNDFYVSKWDANGNFIQAQTYGNTGDDRAFGVKAVSTTAYYVVGLFTNTVDFSTSIVTNTLTALGVYDAFVAKYAPCSTPVQAVAVTPTVMTICALTSTILSVSPVGGVTYNWFYAAAAGTAYGPTASYTTPALSTTTSIWAEATNTCGVGPRTKFIINTLAAPVITVPGSTICSGSSASLTASGASSYTWNTGPTTSSIVVSPITTTNYTVAGTNTLGCSNTKTVSVIVNTTPTVNITVSSASICTGSSASLTASGANTYSWSTGATTTVIAVSPTITTVYTATGTSAVGGCKDTQTLSLTVNSNPTVNITASTPSVCSGSSASLTASGASTYSWSTGATTTVTVVSPTITTIYTATGTSVAGCKNTQTLSLAVTTTPTLVTNNYTICAGGTATLAASGATTYSWSTSQTTSSITVTPTANVVYTVTGNNGVCTDVNTVSVTVGSALSIAVTPSVPSICFGNTGTLTASGATSYTWSTGSNATSIAVSPTINTTYTINGTSGTCAGSKTITMVVNSNPTVTATSSSSLLCTGNSASLTASGANTYVWNPGSLSGATAVVSPTINTTYSVTGTSTAGCTNTKTVSITVSACTGINENQNQTNVISIHPNPNNGEFTILVSEAGVYSIINSIGQLVESVEVKENSQQINVSGLATGIYYVLGKTSRAKIIVTK